MALDSNVLLNEARCLGCGSLSESEMIMVALLQRIAEAGGSGGGGTPGLPLNSIQFNEAGAFGGTSDLTWRNSAIQDLVLTARANVTPFGIIGYSLTGANAQSMISGAGTWNTTGVATAFRMAITNTAVGAGSFLVNILAGAAGATSMFSIGTTGLITSNGGLTTVNGPVTVAGSLTYQFSGRAIISAPANGNIMLGDAANTNFNLLLFGGTTSSFPALKRSAALLQVRLADDSAYASFEANTLRTATAYTVGTLPAAGVQGKRAYVTDALAPAFGAIVAGAGAVIIPVYDDGTNWRVG